MHVEILWRFLAIYRGTQRRFPPKCIENTFQVTQSTCRSLEMHSKRRYKICTCSVILGGLVLLSIIFWKILDAILSLKKMRILLIRLSIAFSSPKILGLLFLQKIA